MQLDNATKEESLWEWLLETTKSPPSLLPNKLVFCPLNGSLLKEIIPLCKEKSSGSSSVAWLRKKTDKRPSRPLVTCRTSSWWETSWEFWPDLHQTISISSQLDSKPWTTLSPWLVMEQTTLPPSKKQTSVSLWVLQELRSLRRPPVLSCWMTTSARSWLLWSGEETSLTQLESSYSSSWLSISWPSLWPS